MITETVVTAAGVGFGLSVGNYAWQIFSKQDWRKAFELSFFQIAALATFVFVLYLHS